MDNNNNNNFNNENEFTFEMLKKNYPQLGDIQFNNNKLIFNNRGSIDLNDLRLSELPQTIFSMDPSNLFIYLENISTFKKRKNSYPRLKDVQCNNNKLIFKDGKIIDLSNIRLSKLNQAIFGMDPNHLFLYLENQFYSIPNQEEINLITGLLMKTNITPKDAIKIKKFTCKQALRYILMKSENAILQNDINFYRGYTDCDRIIQRAYRLASPGAGVIVQTYDDSINEGGNSNERGFARVRSNLPKGYYGSSNDADYDSTYLSAGFVSGFIIIGITIIIGIILAIYLK